MPNNRELGVKKDYKPDERGVSRLQSILAPEFVMEIFLCVPKGFWLNVNNLALPINVLKKKSVTIFPGQKSMPSGVHL